MTTTSTGTEETKPKVDPLVGCRDECGAKIPQSQVESSGWEFLPVQGRYRCVDCWRALKAADNRS